MTGLRAPSWLPWGRSHSLEDVGIVGPRTEEQASAGRTISWPLRLSVVLTLWVLPLCDFWNWLEAPVPSAPPLPAPEVRAVGLSRHLPGAQAGASSRRLSAAALRPATGGQGAGALPNIFQMWPQLPDSLALAGALSQQSPVSRAVRKTKPSEVTGGPASRKGETGDWAGRAVPGTCWPPPSLWPSGPRARPAQPALNLGWWQPSAGCLLGGDLSLPG